MKQVRRNEAVDFQAAECSEQTLKGASTMKRYCQSMVMILVALVAVALIANPAYAARKSGTTLAGYKTLDICKVDDTTWQYSGLIAVWNEGAVDTEGFTINDCLQAKTITGGTQFADVECNLVDTGGQQIPAGTTQLTALTFPYSFESAAYPVDQYYVKNVANMTILNHSGPQYGTPFGPSPKVTWDGGDPPVCDLNTGDDGCTYTQGYWDNKPGVVWPAGYSRDAVFFNATTLVCFDKCGGNPNDDVIVPGTSLTWQQVMAEPVNTSQGYYQLAHQYIAAVLNLAKAIDPAIPPQGVQDTLDLALAWLQTHGPIDCDKELCGDQKDWAAVLAQFNEGKYPGGPLHCVDE
jgi:hypothetical protein